MNKPQPLRPMHYFTEDSDGGRYYTDDDGHVWAVDTNRDEYTISKSGAFHVTNMLQERMGLVRW